MKRIYKNPETDSVAIHSISVILGVSGEIGDIQGGPGGGSSIGGGSGKQAPKIV